MNFLKKHLSKILFILAVAIFICCYYLFDLNKYFTYENVQQVREFILSLSFLGPFFLLLLFTIFGIVILPTFFFIFISGYLYGPIFGALFAWIGMLLGMNASFICIRYIFRNDFNNKFGKNKIVLTVEKYTAKYHGWAVFFFRLTSIFPFNLQNIAYALTSLNPFIHLGASALGIIPITILYSWLGYLLSSNKIALMELKQIFIIIFIVITVIASVFFTGVIIKKKMKYSAD